MNAVDFSTGEEGHLESTIRHLPCSLFGFVCNYMASLHLTKPTNLSHSNIASSSCNWECVTCVNMNHCRCFVLIRQTSRSEFSSKPSSVFPVGQTQSHSKFWWKVVAPNEFSQLLKNHMRVVERMDFHSQVVKWLGRQRLHPATWHMHSYRPSYTNMFIDAPVT